MKAFLLFAFTLSNLYLTFADWEHPHYSYRCLENGDVELFGVHNKSSIKNGTKPGCTHRHNTTLHVYLIGSECLTKKYGNVTISVYDNVFDGVSQPRDSTIAPNIVGGHGGHQFVITCEDIPTKGIIKTVAHVFQGRENNQLPVNYKEVASVEMRFKAVNKHDAPDISTIYIGDEFYMILEYMGDQKYQIIPEECTAFDETWISKGPTIKPSTNDGHFVELWNVNNYNKNNESDECYENKQLLEEFQKGGDGLVFAKMYGFRFKDKDFITITCEVKICGAECASESNQCIQHFLSSTTRRKRSIEYESFQTKKLTKKLRVVDNKKIYLAENNSQQLKWASSLWIMIFATITLHV